MNVTDTASASASLLMDLQVGGTSKFNVGKDGTTVISSTQNNTTINSGVGDFLNFANSSTQTKLVFSFSGTIRGGVRVDSSGNFNWQSTGSQGHQFYAGSGNNQSFSGTGIAVNCQAGGVTAIEGVSVFGSYAFRGGVSTSSNINDLILTRDAANTLAQRNSTNPQAFNIYNTFTNASNYERLRFGWTSNAFEIKPENAGTGSARVIHISGLPTSNPGAGILWNNGGTPAIGT
jgi:hypothetical protein